MEKNVVKDLFPHLYERALSYRAKEQVPLNDVNELSEGATLTLNILESSLTPGQKYGESIGETSGK